VYFAPLVANRVVVVGEGHSVEVQFLATSSEVRDNAQLDDWVSQARTLAAVIREMNAMMPDEMRMSVAYMGDRGAAMHLHVDGASTLYVPFDDSQLLDTARHEMMHAVLQSWADAHAMGEDYQPPDIMPGFPIPEPQLFLSIYERFGQLRAIDAAVRDGGEDPLALAGGTDPDLVAAVAQPSVHQPDRRGPGLGLAVMFSPAVLGTGPSEHPWDNADEMIATAFSQYLSSPRAVIRSMEDTARRVEKAVPDTGIEAWVADMLALLELLAMLAQGNKLEALGKLAELPPADEAAAAVEIEGTRGGGFMERVEQGVYNSYSLLPDGTRLDRHARSPALIGDLPYIDKILTHPKRKQVQ